MLLTCHIDDEVNGGEYLLKGAWEICENDQERELIREEIQALSNYLRQQIEDSKYVILADCQEDPNAQNDQKGPA